MEFAFVGILQGEQIHRFITDGEGVGIHRMTDHIAQGFTFRHFEDHATKVLIKQGFVTLKYRTNAVA